ncbi:complement C1q tumor necrosis factor-related protein 2-like [Mytilus trossulus]|uniref:complement C1q tumor necrosis factor-related protein 2-like n=1 Tax=Mytilus trossulus TaxID=6551 RepID=UPI00300461A3
MFLVVYLLFGLVFVNGVNTKSIQNETVDESKFVTFDMLNNWKRNMTDYITHMVEQNSIKETKKVFFHAKMSATDTTYNKNSIVKFGTLLFNEGNHFNPGDSVFVSPISGVYLFSWTTQTYSGKSVNTELRVDNIIKETLHADLGSAAGRLSVTRVVILKIDSNDHVWIQTSDVFSENFFEYAYNTQSSFTGVLLFSI